MDHVADLPAKLGLLLKAMSLSRVGLAQKMGVDKSLVGRWLTGSVHPTEHNLSRLVSIVAEVVPGFRLAELHEDTARVASRLGVEPPRRPQNLLLGAGSPLADFLDAAQSDIAHRSSAYEGFWRTSRPSLLMQDRIFHDYGMIRRTPDGLLEVVMEGSGLDFGGWAIPVAGNLYAFLFDRTGRTPLTLLFKGVSLPKATLLDGILMMAALDPNRTPAAVPIIIERVADLSGDAETDYAKYREIAESKPSPVEPLARDELEGRLFRATGRAAAIAGDDLFLMVSSAHNLSRGATDTGLIG